MNKKKVSPVCPRCGQLLVRSAIKGYAFQCRSVNKTDIRHIKQTRNKLLVALKEFRISKTA